MGSVYSSTKDVITTSIVQLIIADARRDKCNCADINGLFVLVMQNICVPRTSPYLIPDQGDGREHIDTCAYVSRQLL